MGLDKLANGLTKIVDKYASAVFGGSLVKAKLVYYTKIEDAIEAGAASKELGSIEFFLNPSSITIEREAKLEQEEANQGANATKFKNTFPVCMTLGELWFDTYDERESVREKYIDDLEDLLQYIPDTHVLPVVQLVWGDFTHMTKLSPSYFFYVTKLKVDYTMFLPNAKPVRAKVTLGMEQVIAKTAELAAKQKNSPDHAKLYTVKHGDTLQGIAMAEYDSPRQWRRIANTNDIVDPMELRPGTKLLVPPILK
jgi:nucleoid-associated protein YgaU